MKMCFLFLLMFYYSFVVQAQRSIEGIKPCVDSLVSNLQTKTIYQEVNINSTAKELIINSDNKQHIFHNKAIFSWLEDVEIDSIKAFKLDNGKAIRFVLSVQYYRGTGLGINFFSWLIISPNDTLLEFQSLAENEKLIYFDEKSNNIKFISLSYGDYFFWNRDFDKVDYEMELNEVVNGEAKIIESKNSWCIEK